MKQFITLLAMLVCAMQIGIAQSVPQGMKYQAVARDLNGQLIADRDLQLKISLYSDLESKKIQYTEIHKVTTNSLGLFTLTIGEGLVTVGAFDRVPWSEEDIWMEVAIQTDDDVEFITISNSRMLSVPYAFHAATAGELTGQQDGSRGPGTGNTGGVPSQVWVLAGNLNTDPSRDKLGTSDMKDLIVITNAVERMRVTAHGDVHVLNNLSVGKNLYVAEDVELNGEGGETINNGDFTVENESETHLTGEVTVDGDAQLNSNLVVEGATNLHSTLKVVDDTYLAADLNVNGETHLNHTLDVDGAVDLLNTLQVTGKVEFDNTAQSMDVSTGALVVEGGVGIGKNLNVGGLTTFTGGVSFDEIVEIDNATQSNSSTDGALVVAGGVGVGKNLNVGGKLGVASNSTDYVAAITNTDDGSGDGLEIKLGGIHPAWDGGGYLNVPNPVVEVFDGAIAKVTSWVEGGEFKTQDLLYLNANGYIPGTVCNVINLLVNEINDGLELPRSIPSIHITDPINIFGGWNLPFTDNPPLEIPPLTVPALNTPAIPFLPAIPTADCSGLPSFSMPNINIANVQDGMDNDNQFISFKDRDGRELGSVRAESLSNWRGRFFSGDYFVDLMGEVIGLDVLSGLAGAVNKFTEIASSHNSMGVEYASGHGDYAEWLERIQPDEFISAGDIVGVRAGKITKDLAHAEQVMAVSSKPIVLGNTPAKDREEFGNKIAFMGQIPVKVMGAVTAGDYIVGNPATPGYGVAIHPESMTSADVKLTVGRAWESKGNDGPKMVNTVIGVDNGQFLTMIRKNQQEMNAMATRMNEMEAKLNVLLNGYSVPTELSADATTGVKVKSEKGRR